MRSEGPFHKQSFAVACGFGAAAVMLGAFGAHALKDQLSPDMLTVYHTAVDYHFIHAAALLASALLPCPPAHPGLRRLASIFFGLGIILFSGSLYALALSGISRLGLITPFGGLFFIAGWILLLSASLRRAQPGS
jgi:uncharacterized membrane protein YgdD (TMEM256/DUF423 family)